MTITNERREEIRVVAVRLAHAGWDGGGGLDRISRFGDERHQPLPRDMRDATLRLGAMDDDERALFRAMFAGRAAEIDN